MPTITTSYYYTPRPNHRGIRAAKARLVQYAKRDGAVTELRPRVDVDWGAAVKKNKRLYTISLRYERKAE